MFVLAILGQCEHFSFSVMFNSINSYSHILIQSTLHYVHAIVSYPW